MNLQGPLTDSDSLAFGNEALSRAEAVYQRGNIHLFRRRDSYQNVGVEGSYGLCVPYLSYGTEERIVRDDTGIYHFVQEARDLLHPDSLQE